MKVKLLLILTMILSLFLVSNTFAEEFQSAQDVSFTFSSTVGVTVSSNNLTIGSLAPGSYSDSNIITVTATSNAIGGYQLNSTIGNTTYNYTDLRISSSDTSHIFSNLGSSSVSSLANLGNSKWGYSYSINSGSTWRSGNIDSTSPNPYGGYTNTSTTITHINTTAPGSSSIQYKIGAKASATQAAGTYQNVVNFAIIANPDPEPWDGTMQKATLADCGQTMTDNRDGEQYTTNTINGQCWMTQNLRITHSTGENAGVILSEGSNFSGQAITMTYGTNFNNTNVAQYYPSSNTSYGVWYSFCAAGAKTSGACNNTAYSASTDICPASWRLPSKSQFEGIVNYASAFSPVVGGIYESNEIWDSDIGFWWTSTDFDGQNHYYAAYYNNAFDIGEPWDYSKRAGSPIRCILST